MKEQILEFRAQGKTYREIKELLGCSKGTISYHCGEGQKEKSNNRRKILRSDVRGAVLKKVYAFAYDKRKRKFDSPEDRIVSDTFYEEALNKIIDNPYCYLTGREIDLSDSQSYHLDHIVPFSKGGSNNIDNLGLTCREANQSKRDLPLDEFISLCKEIIKNMEK